LIKNNEAQKILEKWLGQNKDKDLDIEYFVNGVTNKDQAFISVSFFQAKKFQGF
jgi:hypothetical protein